MKSINEIQFSSQIQQKLIYIQKIVQNKKVIVAYSGGIDSTLLCVLMKEYTPSFLAVFIQSPLSPTQELNNARNFSQDLQFPLRIISIDMLHDPNFQRNDLNRCYYCKKRILTELHLIARNEGYDLVVDGTNFSDLTEIRAGLKALKESTTKSPFAEAEITKNDILEITQILQLPSLSIPSQACLASRIPFNLPLTPKLLNMVDQAERFIITAFSIHEPLRVRLHQIESNENYLARIEAGVEFLSLLQDVSIRNQMNDKFQKLGFVFTTLDLLGFQSGSMHKMHHKKID